MFTSLKIAIFITASSLVGAVGGTIWNVAKESSAKPIIKPVLALAKTHAKESDDQRINRLAEESSNLVQALRSITETYNAKKNALWIANSQALQKYAEERVAGTITESQYQEALVAERAKLKSSLLSNQKRMIAELDAEAIKQKSQWGAQN
jgi:hypothetical protein